MKDFETQYNYLMFGVDKVITEQDFKSKLKRSLETGKPLKVKLGVDPTAPDIHLGHTVVLKKLRQFQECGHQAILLIGGFTAQIGDPSGKSKTRPPLSTEDIEYNANTYLDQVKKILLPENLKIVDNREWLSKLNMNDIFKLFSTKTMAKLLEHNTFKDRFHSAESIYMHEFIYPFLQGYDSIHLEADVELGGSDQLFNIAFGRELQKDFGQESQCALLMPILTGTDGEQKMSKSLGNYIGISESPKVMTQKLLNMTDSNIPGYFKLLTLLGPEEVSAYLNTFETCKDTEAILKLKHDLIAEILRIYHPGKSAEDTEIIRLPLTEFVEGKLTILKALSLCGFIKSNREGVQHIENGSVKINQEKIDSRHFEIDSSILPATVSLGKKKIVTVDIQR